jgi:hypothetical protein
VQCTTAERDNGSQVPPRTASRRPPHQDRDRGAGDGAGAGIASRGPQPRRHPIPRRPNPPASSTRALTLSRPYKHAELPGRARATRPRTDSCRPPTSSLSPTSPAKIPQTTALPKARTQLAAGDTRCRDRAGDDGDDGDAGAGAEPAGAEPAGAEPDRRPHPAAATPHRLTPTAPPGPRPRCRRWCRCRDREPGTATTPPPHREPTDRADRADRGPKGPRRPQAPRRPRRRPGPVAVHTFSCFAAAPSLTSP